MDVRARVRRTPDVWSAIRKLDRGCRNCGNKTSEYAVMWPESGPFDPTDRCNFLQSDFWPASSVVRHCP